MTTIVENIQRITQQIHAFERRYERQPGSVELLGVSKKQAVDKINEAYAAGLRHFGENYVQEAIAKIQTLNDLNCQWHFVGPIQSNKTRAIAEHFHWVHSIEREKIARRLSEQRPGSMPPLNVCIQVNLSGEDSKSGVSLAQCPALCQAIVELPNLRLRGLMTIPAPMPALQSQRDSYRRLADCLYSLQPVLPNLDTLSMGMSDDFEAAIAEGATIVRLGTALFGPRS